jgi:hypothetical protein
MVCFVKCFKPEFSPLYKSLQYLHPDDSTPLTTMGVCYFLLLSYIVYNSTKLLHHSETLIRVYKIYTDWSIELHSYPYPYQSPLTSTTPALLFLLSAAHFSIQALILVLLAALPTFTVGTIFPIRSPHANSVSSLKLLCSEYGTPKHAARRVLPRCGTRSAEEKEERQCGELRMVGMEGLVSDLGGVKFGLMREG